jgi:hypothetical protein
MEATSIQAVLIDQEAWFTPQVTRLSRNSTFVENSIGRDVSVLAAEYRL